MRFCYPFFFILASLFTPAIAADDQCSQQEVIKIAAAFTENFDKQNSAGIAALFAKDGVFVNPIGPHTDVAQFYAAAFKAGISQIEITVKQATALDANTMVGLGEFKTGGRNSSGAAVGELGLWTAIYIRHGGTWKSEC